MDKKRKITAVVYSISTPMAVQPKWIINVKQMMMRMMTMIKTILIHPQNDLLSTTSRHSRHSA